MFRHAVVPALCAIFSFSCQEPATETDNNNRDSVATTGPHTDSDSSGDTDLTTDSGAPDTPFTTIVPLPIYGETTHEGFPVAYYIPSPLRGVVFAFHPTGQGAKWIDSIETTAVLNAMVQAGIGFISPTATDVSGRWDASHLDVATNLDLQRIQRLRTSIQDITELNDATPVFAIGHSTGATFAATLANTAMEANWPIKAISMHNSDTAGTMTGIDIAVPTLFTVSANDSIADNEAITARYNHQIDAGYAAQYLTWDEGPLEPLRFMRIHGVDESTSREAFQILVDLGAIDDSGMRLIDLKDTDQVVQNFRDAWDGAHEEELVGQLKVVWAVHMFSGWYASDEVLFFDERL